MKSMIPLRLIFLCANFLVSVGCTGLTSDSSKATLPEVVQSNQISKVSISQLRGFFRDCSYYEFQKALEETKRVFVVGGMIEGYPDVLPFFTNFSHRISDLLKREGFDEEGVKGILLFSGGNGILNHDIVVLVVHETGVVMGVYDVMWGR